MRKITKRLTDTLTWAATSTVSVDLPREGLITEVRFRADITASAALSTAQQPQSMWRVVESLKIEGDGGRAYLGLDGEQTGRLLAFQNLCMGFKPLLTLQTATEEHQTFVFHPGSNPRDPFDLTAAIPARALSTLQLKWGTGAAADVDDSATISSGTGYVEVDEILDVPVPKGLMTPMGSTKTDSPTATASDFSHDIDIPAGAWLRSIWILVQDETATRPVLKDDQVTGVRVKMPKSGEYVMESNWEDLKAKTARYFGYAGAPLQVADATAGRLEIPDGLAIIDFRQFAHPIYGLDLRNYQTGDFKLGLTIGSNTSGDDEIIYWDQLLPVDSVYVGK